MKIKESGSFGRLLYLCKGDEEQLLVRVSEAGQWALRTVFPHPLLIRLGGEREAVTNEGRRTYDSSPRTVPISARRSLELDRNSVFT